MKLSEYVRSVLLVLQSELKEKNEQIANLQECEEPADINSWFIARKQRKNSSFGTQKMVTILEVTSVFITIAIL